MENTDQKSESGQNSEQNSEQNPGQSVSLNKNLGRLSAAIDSGTRTQIGSMIRALHPSEIARLLESLPPAKRNLVWQVADPEDGGEILVDLNEEVRARLIEDMAAEDVVAATESLEIDDLADLVADLPEDITLQILRSLSQRDRARLESVMAWPEDSAGGLMNPATVSVRPNVTVDVVLRYLRMLGKLPDNTSSVFVVSQNNRYLGTVLLSRLVTSDPQEPVSSILDEEATAIPVAASESEVATAFQDLDMTSAAVVDQDNRLLGQITVDDVVDVIKEQADHDILSMAGLDEDDDMFAPVVTSSRRRAIWLGVNLATAFLAAAVVGMFQPTLEKVVILAVLMPVVASMGGIAGNQTLTLMIRGMALGRVQDSNARWLLTKEILVAILNSLFWALVVAAVTVVFFASWKVGAIIAAALTINLLAAALAGFIIPMVLRRLNIDAALAGGVILTTITDVTGFIAFLGLGTIFLL